MYIVRHIRIYNAQYNTTSIFICIQTSKTATFLLIYSSNLSGVMWALAIVLYVLYILIQHMRPKSLKNWLGFHEKDFSDNLKKKIGTIYWIRSDMLETKNMCLKIEDPQKPTLWCCCQRLFKFEYNILI